MNLQLLKAPFAPHDHEFDYDGNIYIQETAITERLDLICGIDGWSLLHPHPPICVTDTHWIVTAELSIATPNGWVARTNTGEGVTAISKKINWDDKRYVSNMNQHTPKKAATDALKRAARLWGIGRYLLKTPDWVKQISDVGKWLTDSGQVYGLLGKANWWQYLQDDSDVMGLYEHKNHVVNTLKKLSSEYDMDTITYGAIRQILIDRKTIDAKAS